MMDKEILEEKTTNSVTISITGPRKTKYFIILIILFIADDPQSAVRSKATSSLKDWKNGGKKLSASMRSFRTITEAPQYYSVFTHALVRGPGISFAANETLIGYVSLPYFDNLLISNVFLSKDAQNKENCKSQPNFRKRQIALYSPCRSVGWLVDVTINFFNI